MPDPNIIINKPYKKSVMKKFLFLSSWATIVVMVACSSSKSTPSTPSGAPASVVRSTVGEVLPEEVCYVLAEEAPSIRKVGNGQHFKESSAKNLAEAQARGEFARSMAAAILSATEELGVSLDLYAGDANEGMMVRDQSSESGDYVMSIASEIVKNTHVIKTSRYIKPNNQYNVYVCLEYMGGENQMVQDIEDALKEKISPDQRQILEQRHDKFRQRVLSAIR